MKEWVVRSIIYNLADRVIGDDLKLSDELVKEEIHNSYCDEGFDCSAWCESRIMINEFKKLTLEFISNQKRME